MPELTAFYAPGSCSRATLICLEETGAPYKAQLVSFMQRENRTPEFLALNPKGKIPVLLVDGKPLTETVAIVDWLNSAFPDAGLMPPTGDAFAKAKALSDLAWASSALHALIARVRFPMMYTPLAEAHESVRAGAVAGLHDAYRIVEARLADSDWWHGTWSAQDAYLYWVWTRAAEAGFPGEQFAAYTAHNQRMGQRASVRAVLALEAEGDRDLAARGASIPN